MQNIEAEQCLIGAVLMRNDLFPLVSEKVSHQDFFEPLHQVIWETCTSLITMGKLASPLTVLPFLPADMKVGEGVTLKQYLARLAAASCTVSEAPHLASLVRDLAHRRAIAAVGNELQSVQAPDVTGLAAWGVDELDQIATARTERSTPAVTMAESAARAVDGIAKAYQNDGALTGIPYRLDELDQKTNGLQRGELTILAGRPGMMKTGLALNFVRRMSEAGYHGLFFSLEMKDTALSRRIFSDLIFEQKEVPYSQMSRGKVSEAEFMLIREAAVAVQKWPLRIEQSDASMSQISARARQWKRRHGLDYLIVDHMGHVQASDRYRGNRNNELSEVSGGLMRLARELDIGVIALCQLSRAVESRENKRPVLADLRESGAIEQDAATVLFVYREAYYLQNSEPRAGTPEYEIWTEKMLQCLNKLEIVVSKQRDGATGSIHAYVDVRCNAVRNAGWSREFNQQATEEFAF